MSKNKLTIKESMETYGTAFLNREQVAEFIHAGHKTVCQLFNDPEFPALQLGNEDVVELNALLAYCSQRRDRKSSTYWRNAYITSASIDDLLGGYYYG